MSEPLILLADDDVDFCRYCEAALKAVSSRLQLCHSRAEAERFLRNQPVDLLLSDLEFPDGSGLELLAAGRECDPDLVITLVTGKGTIQSALEAMKQGAFDYLLKPVPPGELRAHVQKALAHRALRVENRDLKKQLAEQESEREIVGDSPAIRAVLKLIEKAAPHESTILITGESGTGKELAARTLHNLSPRCKGPFVAINCSALPETLLESELFGHEKGAFTGAVASRKGVFAQANGGTLLLDEIGTMPPALQARLLRVLEERQVRPVGGERSFPVDVRVMAATNANLRELIQGGKFREDLFFRIHVVTIAMPPLRDRKEDIAPLARHFLKHTFSDGPLRRIDPRALKILESYSWPGNVRQLANVIERAGVLAETDCLTAELLPVELTTPSSPKRTKVECQTLAEMEKQQIEQVLESLDWHRSQAAEKLGISRRTLYNKMREYQITPPDEK